MRRRGCLIALGTFAGLILLCCGIGWFVGLPRIRDDISDQFSNTLSTEIAGQLDSVPGTLEPGTYQLSVTDLRSQIDANLDSGTASNIQLSVDPEEISFGFTSNQQDFVYTGRPVARDGRLEIDDMTVNNDFLGFVLSADRAADIIERSVNDYFEARGLEIESIELGNDVIEFTTVAAGS